MRWVLYEDPEAHRLRPFTWLRPPSALLLGAETLEARWRRHVAPEAVHVVCEGALAAVVPSRVSWEQAAPAATEAAVWVSDLWVPDANAVATLRSLPADGMARLAGTAGADGPICAFRPGSAIGRRLREAGPRAASTPASLASSDGTWAEVGGEWLRSPADLIRLQEPLLHEDLERLLRDTPASSSASAGDGAMYERSRIRLGRDCRVDHGAVLDARRGPIVLSEGCHVFPQTWVRGPFFADHDCLLLGGTIGSGSSLGPGCRVRGEVEATVFLGWANKAHDGFIGHSYLGEWVNLGALTTTSDLKNNYSEIGLERNGVRETTGLRKLGVFFGDHVKTRIGCLLGCGTILGVGANLIGDPAVGARWVPDFSWGWGPTAAEYGLERFLETAEIVLGRRGHPWTPEMARLLGSVHAATRNPRAGARSLRGPGGRSDA